MFSKAAHVLVSLMLMLSMGWTHACAVLSSCGGEPPCRRSENMNGAGGPLSSKPCAMSHCRSVNGQVFTVTNSSSSRTERERTFGSKVLFSQVTFEIKEAASCVFPKPFAYLLHPFSRHLAADLHHPLFPSLLKPSPRTFREKGRRETACLLRKLSFISIPECPISKRGNTLIRHCTRGRHRSCFRRGGRMVIGLLGVYFIFSTLFGAE